MARELHREIHLRPGEEIAHSTEHFEVVVNESGRGTLVRTSTGERVGGRSVPAEYAGLFAEIAELGYHQGARDSLGPDAAEILAFKPITYPRPIVRKTEE